MPAFLYYLEMLYVVLQLFFLNSWGYLIGIINKNDTASKIYNKLFSIFVFISNDESTEKNPYIYFTVLTVACLLFIIAVVVQTLSYRNTRTFSKPILYFIRLVIEILIPCYMIPSSSYAGWCVQLIIDKKSTISVAYLVLTLIYFLVFALFFAITFRLFSISPFLSRSPIAMWDSREFLQFFFIESVFSFVQCFFTNFEWWIRPIFIAIHAGFLVYTIIRVYTLYFVSIKETKFFASAISAFVVLNVIAIVGTFTDVSSYAPMIALIPSMIAGLVISHFTVKALEKKVIYVLNLPQADAEVEYENERIKDIYSRSVMYLHYGLREICPRSIDFSLQKYLIANTTNIDVLAEVLKLICCFPQESRLMSQLFNVLISKRDLSYAHRFMLYQTERIKAVRQCSSSIDTGELFQRQLTSDNQCIDEITGFWKHLTSSIAPVEKISTTIIKIENQWKEILDAYPNNTRFREEFSRFLIECKSDFTGGILQKFKVQQIEQGFNFATDKAFRYFIANYPSYLRKNIVDFKGNILVNIQKKKGSTTSTNSSSGSQNVLSSSNQLSAEVEENIGKTLFSQSKTRIALQYAFYKRKSTPIETMKKTVLCIMLLQVVAAIVVYFIFYNIFSGKLEDYEEIITLNNIRFYFGISTFASYIRWGDKRGLVGTFPAIDGETDYFFDSSTNITKIIVDAASSTRSYLSSVMILIASRAVEGNDISKDAQSFITNGTGESYCNGFTIEDKDETSMQSSISHSLSSIEVLANVEDAAGYNNNKDLCELIMNYPSVSSDSDEIVQSMKNSAEEDNKQSKRVHMFVMIIVPAVLVVIIIPIMLINLAFVFKDQRKILGIMKSFSEQQINEAIQPIMIDQTKEVAAGVAVDNEDIRDNHFCAYAFFFVGGIIVPAILAITIYLSSLYINIIDEVLNWVYLSSSRNTYLIESFSALSLSVLLKVNDANFDRTSFTGTNYLAQLNKAKDYLNLAANSHFKLLLGDDESGPFQGYSDEFDKINTQAECSTVNLDEGSHAFMKCASLSQLFETIQATALTSLAVLTNLKDETFFSLSHILFNHAFEKIVKSTDCIYEYAEDKIQKHSTLMLFLVLISVIVAVIICIIGYIVTKGYNRTYETALHVLLRATPTAISSNSDALNFLMNREASSDGNTGTMTMSRKIIHNSADPIICLGANEAIEQINKAVGTLFGYTPEQVLGQQVDFLFDAQSMEEIEKQMTMMRTGQSRSYEGHVTCLTDSDTPVHCFLTLIGMAKTSNGYATSFVIILRDEGELIKSQGEAEEAKKKSEALLYQILPMDIVLRLNRGEKNISFSVPSATIVFVDVQRFSDYASALTPSQIMGSLSLLFGTFDSVIAKYNLMIKIKLIGDVYMAAGGLFNPDEQPVKHAEQVVRFGLDVLSELEDVNNKLSSNLSVRIGINTGGPLLAGVLGTDKPAFDIIGDPINVAARLQSTDIAGKIQISQETYDLVQGFEFNIEKRGEVFLKGKGKSIAYLVNPNLAFPLALSSSGMSLPSIAAINQINNGTHEI